MNNNLVDSLVHLADTLTCEEKYSLESRLWSNNSSQENYQNLLKIRAKIFARQGWQALFLTEEEIILQFKKIQAEQPIPANLSKLEASKPPK